VPLSFQYQIRDDAMTAKFEIGAKDVEGYDAIVGQAAWLGLRLRHWPLPFLVHAERLTLNQSKTYADLERRPCCVEENEMSYHIEINEYQRRLIMKALTSTDVNQFSQAPGSGDAFDTEAKEFVCLVQMFGTMKALTSTDVNQFSQAPGSGDAFDTEAKEFVCLVQMFGTLALDDTTRGAC
jgi:hypothetical protein